MLDTHSVHESFIKIGFYIALAPWSTCCDCPARLVIIAVTCGITHLWHSSYQVEPSTIGNTLFNFLSIYFKCACRDTVLRLLNRYHVFTVLPILLRTRFLHSTFSHSHSQEWSVILPNYYTPSQWILRVHQLSYVDCMLQGTL